MVSRTGSMRIVASLIAGAVLATCALWLFGWLRPPQTLEPARKVACAWPQELDAVAAAPANHKVLLENDRVRVLDVTVAPGEKENLHAHCRHSFMYLMYEGVYRDYGPNGELLSENKAAPPPDQFPMSLWLEPQGPHAVENLDSRPVRLLRVELKD